MSFKFLKLKASNFVLYESLEIDFRKLGGNLIFITGKNLETNGLDSNGSGKTLIGDILTDLLFDRTIRRHSQKSFIGEFKKWCFSSLLIEDSISNKRFLIKKYRNHKKYGDKLFFIEEFNGKKKDLSRKRKADTYGVIARVLGINWKTFKNRNYFGQDDSERFLKVTDAKKAEIIIDIQDLFDFQEAKKVSNDNLKEVKSKIEVCEEKLSSLSEKIGLIKSLEEAAETKRGKSLLDKEKALGEVTEERLRRKKEAEELGSVSMNILNTEKKLEDLRKKGEEGEKLLLDRNALNLTLLELVKGIVFETEMKRRVADEILQAKNEIGDLKNQVIITCSKCGAKLTKQRLLKSIKTLQMQVKEKNAKKEAFLEKEIQLERKKEKAGKALIEVKKSLKILAPILENRVQLRDDLRLLRKKEIKIAVLASKIEGLIESEKRIKKEIEELEKGDYLSSFIEEEKLRKKQKKSKEKELRELAVKKEKNEFSKAVFDKTMRNLFDGFLDNLNHYSNTFLDHLCDNDISVVFTSKTERESKKIVDEIKVLVSVDGAKSRDFRTYSQGEKSRIDLVTQLVLFSSTDSGFPFLFLDEPFLGVDQTGRERMINLLQNISEEGNLVFVVSNKNVPTGYGQKMQVVREKGKAVIENG